MRLHFFQSQIQSVCTLCTMTSVIKLAFSPQNVILLRAPEITHFLFLSLITKPSLDDKVRKETTSQNCPMSVQLSRTKYIHDLRMPDPFFVILDHQSKEGNLVTFMLGQSNEDSSDSKYTSHNDMRHFSLSLPILFICPINTFARHFFYFRLTSNVIDIQESIFCTLYRWLRKVHFVDSGRS